MSRFSNLTLRSRVILVAAIGVGLMVSLVAMAAYATARVSLNREADANLLNRAYAAVTGPLADPTVLARIPPEALGAADLRVGLLDARTGRGYSPFGDRRAPPVSDAEWAVARGQLARSVQRSVGNDGDTYRVVAVPADNGRALVLAQSTEDIERTLDKLGLVLLVFGGAGVLLAAWGGFGIARTALRPVERLTAAAEHVARTGDLTPIPVSGRDELARLAHSFNTMLIALDEARRRQRQLIADAGHELRTPLTSLRTNIDLFIQSEQARGEQRPGLSPEDRAALVRDIRTQAEELTTLVGDLVELSRDDAPSATRELLDFADVVRRAVERVRPRAATARFEVNLTPWWVSGDATSLERAATNLLDNAAKWSPPHGRIRVTLSGGVLSVEDEGPGIAPADLPFVFERFYRSTEARTMPGSGLGLAIVKQAAERHGGWVSADRSPLGGALLRVGLPGGPVPPR